jgi:chitodextrinase
LEITGPQNFAYMAHPFNVVPGADYSLSFYAKGSGNFTYRVKPAGSPAIAKADTLNNETDWKKYTLDFTAPAGVTTLDLHFLDVPKDKVAYVDDVEIHEVRELNSAKEMTAFGFPELGLTGNVNNTAITVNAPYGTDVTNLLASFSLSVGATATVGTAVQTSGVTANDFSSPVAYTVTAEDGSSKVYTVTVNVAPPVDSTLAPVAASFDKNVLLQADVSVALTLNGNTLTGIKNGATPLVPGTDYSISGSQVMIKQSYLATLPVGKTVLTFEMSAGTDPALTVSVAESKPQIASVSIAGPNTVLVSSPGISVVTAQFQATVRDQFNQAVSGETVTWSLQAPAPGVSLDTATGLLIAGSGATAGSRLVVLATLNYDPQIKSEYPVYLADSGTPYWPINNKLAASQIGDDYVVLTWPAAQDDQGIARYELYQESGTTQLAVDAAYSYSVTDSVYSSRITGLAPGTKYTFNVKAFDNAGKYTGAGLEVTAKTSMDALPPVWPAGKSLTVKAVTESSVTLEWSPALDNRGVDRYVVVRDGTDVATTDATVREFVLEGLTPGTEYRIGVDAVDLKGNRSADGPTLALTIPDNSGVTVSTNYTVGTETNATELAASRMLSADATVKNNLLVSKQVLVTVALYDPDGAMLNASYLSMQLSAGETWTLHAGFKLPSDIASHQVKTFVWEGTDPLNSNANPITEASVLP